MHPGAILVFYGLMAVAALVWGGLRGQPNVFVAYDAGVGVPTQVLSGVAVGLPIVFFSRMSARWFDWARRLEDELRRLLGPLTGAHILALAAGSAIGEEMLFRGAMQSAIGFGATTILFGIAHVPPRADLWPWTVWALAAGALLGGIVELTGTLLGAIIAHFTINWFNLHSIVRRTVTE